MSMFPPSEVADTPLVMKGRLPGHKREITRYLNGFAKDLLEMLAGRVLQERDATQETGVTFKMVCLEQETNMPEFEL